MSSRGIVIGAVAAVGGAVVAYLIYDKFFSDDDSGDTDKNTSTKSSTSNTETKSPTTITDALQQVSQTLTNNSSVPVTAITNPTARSQIMSILQAHGAPTDAAYVDQIMKLFTPPQLEAFYNTT